MTHATNEDPSNYILALQDLIPNPVSALLDTVSELKLTMTTELAAMKATQASLTMPPPAPPPAKPSALSKTPSPPMAKLPTPPKVQAPPTQAPPKPPAQRPTFASAAKVPMRPSLVLTPAPDTSSSPSLAVRKTPSEICEHLNHVLSGLHPGSSISAA
ncbi:hypothetical protein EDB83DRAFT_2531261 [Lactarius deliciosus]|nr:hypothetical protein EDB83DRAFT_2531261 [Lactarius deliciosus]